VRVTLDKVTFRMISDPAAQVAAMLSGDVDAFPRFASFDSVGQFQNDPRFQVMIGGTEGKTILAINNKRKPLDDVRVRQAIAYAIDRKAIIDGAMNGYGTPIGSHAVPDDPGYLDLTGMYAYDPAKAQTLLKEAGVALPLHLTLTLPPPSYARRGGEIIAAELAKVGIEAKIENVEWAQWLSGVFTNKNYDLSVISHVEPLDLMIYANPNYYFQYDGQAFRDIMAKANSASDREERLKALGEAQRKLAEDAVNAFLFQLPQVCVADKRIKGLWKDAPIFANDMAAISWQ
jgi:peptide/nickel transport system substrate-binding protein